MDYPGMQSPAHAPSSRHRTKRNNALVGIESIGERECSWYVVRP